MKFLHRCFAFILVGAITFGLIAVKDYAYVQAETSSGTPPPVSVQRQRAKACMRLQKQLKAQVTAEQKEQDVFTSAYTKRKDRINDLQKITSLAYPTVDQKQLKKDRAILERNYQTTIASGVSHITALTNFSGSDCNAGTTTFDESMNNIESTYRVLRGTKHTYIRQAENGVSKDVTTIKSQINSLSTNSTY